jgi:hypothetical protein
VNSLPQAVLSALLVLLLVGLGLVVAWIAILIACSFLSWIDSIVELIPSRRFLAWNALLFLVVEWPCALPVSTASMLHTKFFSALPRGTARQEETGRKSLRRLYFRVRFALFFNRELVPSSFLSQHKGFVDGDSDQPSGK